MSFQNIGTNLPSLLRSTLLIVAEVDSTEYSRVIDVVSNLLPGSIVKRHVWGSRAGQFDELRSEPAFQELVAKVGLPQASP